MIVAVMPSLKSLTNVGTDMGVDFGNGAAVGTGIAPAVEKGDTVAPTGAGPTDALVLGARLSTGASRVAASGAA